MKEKLKTLIENFRRQEVVERLLMCKNAEEALEEYRKIKSSNITILNNFNKEFFNEAMRISYEYKIRGTVYSVINLRPKKEDAVIICIICYMAEIADDELLDYALLKRALKNQSREKSKLAKVAKAMYTYMYKDDWYLDELPSEKDFVKFFIQK